MKNIVILILDDRYLFLEMPPRSLKSPRSAYLGIMTRFYTHILSHLYQLLSSKVPPIDAVDCHCHSVSPAPRSTSPTPHAFSSSSCSPLLEGPHRW